MTNKQAFSDSDAAGPSSAALAHSTSCITAVLPAWQLQAWGWGLPEDTWTSEGI